MKKKLALVAAVGVLLSGCGGKTEESAAPATTTAASTAAATTTAAKTTETVTLAETLTEGIPAPEEPQGIAVVGPGETCGTVSSTLFPGLDGREVTIESGAVDCVEAYEIMMTYVNTEAGPDNGNTNAQEFGDWACMAPTAASSEQLQQAAVCTKPSGERIYLPK